MSAIESVAAPGCRVRTLPELLDATFQILRARFFTMLAASVCASLPLVCVALVWAGAGGVDDVFGLVLITAFPFANAAAVVVAGDTYQGRGRTTWVVVAAVYRRSPAILGAFIATYAMVLYGFMLLLVPGFIALAATFVMKPAMLVEGVTLNQAWERGKALARGHRVRICAAALLSWLLAGLAAYGALKRVGALLDAIGYDPSYDAAEVLVAVIYTAACTIPGTVAAVVYFDQRIRKEALDVQMAARALGGEVPAPPQPAWF